MSSMSMLSTGGGIPIRQTKLAPDGVEFSEDVSEARWVEERLSAFGTLRSLLPEGFAAYARIFHPAYLNRYEERPAFGVSPSEKRTLDLITDRPMIPREHLASGSASRRDGSAR